ncbi:MAG TPA: hypothetical protein VE687_12595, partial [Stellaceae bacterium]|nr:hypothetical protein [Stellaceae bacterium]
RRWNISNPSMCHKKPSIVSPSGSGSAPHWFFVERRSKSRMMKRIGAFAFYAVGALAVLYLALYAYAAFTGRQFQPGDPIHIFRRPDAPSYS